MKAKLAIAAVLIIGVVGYAYVHSYPPFASQFLLICDKGIKQRLADPSTYQRIGADESKRTISFDEFFTDPIRAASEETKKILVQDARFSPVQRVAIIDYQIQDSIGAIIRESATCTFNSIDGTDAPHRGYLVKIDGEYNMDWAARQRNSDIIIRRLVD